jgi:hypothetical protein
MRAREFLKELQNLDDIKNNIVQSITPIFNIDELNKIYSYIKKVDIGKGFDEIFNKDQDLKQIHSTLSRAVIDANGTFEEKMAFANELSNIGVVDANMLLNPNVPQNIKDITVTDYPNMLQQIMPELLNIAGAYSSGKTKTNRGKGEFFLAICSPEISMSKNEGDLIVNGQPVEVKGNLARIKGRKGYGTTDAAYTQVKKSVDQFLKENLPQVAAPQFVVTIGAKSNFWSAFGPFCIQQGLQPNVVVEFIKEKLKIIVRSLYLTLDNNSVETLQSTINEQGVLDFAQFTPIIKEIAFAYYQAADKFLGILFINSNNLNFIYIDNPQSFAQQIKIKAFGFETGQQNGMQITIK